MGWRILRTPALRPRLGWVELEAPAANAPMRWRRMRGRRAGGRDRPPTSRTKTRRRPPPRAGVWSAAPPRCADQTGARSRPGPLTRAVAGTGTAAGADRFVTSYHVRGAGNRAGSGVANTRRWCVAGPSGPAVAASAHQVAVWSSRKRRATATQSPGSAGPPHALTWAATATGCTVPTGAHHACAGLSAMTSPTPSGHTPVRTPSFAPEKRSATTARKG